MFSRNVVSGGELLLWGEKCEKRPKNKQNLLLFWGENFPPEVSENNTAPEFVAFHASSHLSFPCWPSSSAFEYYCKTGVLQSNRQQAQTSDFTEPVEAVNVLIFVHSVSCDIF